MGNFKLKDIKAIISMTPKTLNGELVSELDHVQVGIYRNVYGVRYKVYAIVYARRNPFLVATDCYSEQIIA